MPKKSPDPARTFLFVALCLSFIFLSSCSSSGTLIPTHVPQTTVPSLPAASTSTLSPTRTPTTLPSPTLTITPPTSPTSTFQVCSPLSEVSISELEKMINNRYNPPRPGSDDPHQGVDFGDILPGTSISQEGRVVQAAHSGRVAAVLNDRFPYGNAVLIETRLEDTPWTDLELIPTPAPTLAVIPALTCPPANDLIDWQTNQRSLYTLYAHMLDTPAVELGQEVACGEPLGKVGNSGNSINPHLHIETRIGPAGAQIGSMAHYSNSASLAEMGAYCLWRVSAAFQTINPMELLFAGE